MPGLEWVQGGSRIRAGSLTLSPVLSGPCARWYPVSLHRCPICTAVSHHRSFQSKCCMEASPSMLEVEEDEKLRGTPTWWPGPASWGWLPFFWCDLVKIYKILDLGPTFHGREEDITTAFLASINDPMFLSPLSSLWKMLLLARPPAQETAPKARPLGAVSWHLPSILQSWVPQGSSSPQVAIETRVECISKPWW